MYASHVPIIAGAMRACPDTFAMGIMFAVVSARVQFPRVPDAMAELRTRTARASCLWGWKADAYRHVQAHKAELHARVYAAHGTEAALAVLCEVPGLGLVKAGFVLQLAGFDIGCLDTRNIKRLGLKAREYRSDGAARKATAAFKRKLERYVAHTGGRAQELWDDWCKDVGQGYGLPARDVSAMHLCFVPPELRTARASVPHSTPVGGVPF